MLIDDGWRSRDEDPRCHDLFGEMLEDSGPRGCMCWRMDARC